MTSFLSLNFYNVFIYLHFVIISLSSLSTSQPFLILSFSLYCSPSSFSLTLSLPFLTFYLFPLIIPLGFFLLYLHIIILALPVFITPKSLRIGNFSFKLLHDGGCPENANSSGVNPSMLSNSRARDIYIILTSWTLS